MIGARRPADGKDAVLLVLQVRFAEKTFAVGLVKVVDQDCVAERLIPNS